VVRETRQTFVAAIRIAARDFIHSPIHLKQVQFLSAHGDKAFVASTGNAGLLRRTNALRASARIESAHEFARH
jgi:hypothetical protein